MTKRIAPAAIQALKEALTLIYWYKGDLRSFLSQCLSTPELLARLNWQDFKRNIVGTLVDHLTQNEDTYQNELVGLMSAVCQVEDFSHLLRLDDGRQKAKDASEAVNALRVHIAGHRDLQNERQQVEARKRDARKNLARASAVHEKLEEIGAWYSELALSDDPQNRGFLLEKVLKCLFEVFDLDPKASFRISGEQIDGAFSFEGTDYLLEAKWQKEPVNASALDGLSGKLTRKLDNTLGLFLSVDGYSSDAIKTVSSGRRMVILMDGSDLMAVLEGRIALDQLLLRKRRYAAQTGRIYLRVADIL